SSADFSSAMHTTTPSLHSFPTRRSSDLTFSRLLMPPRLDTTRPLVRKPLERRVSRADCPSSTSRASPAESGPSWAAAAPTTRCRSEEHTSELQSRGQLVCRLLREKKKPP